MNKILILTAGSNRHYYFINKILNEYPKNTKVVLNGKGVKRSRFEIRKRQLKRPFTFIKNKILNIAFAKYGEKLNFEKQKSEEFYFAGQQENFLSKYSCHILDTVNQDDRSLNSARVVAVIKQYEPNIIIVMGTCLVSHEIIKSADVVLNMHTGLSPYYRGGASNFWPFINNDTDKFGVTIHLMTTGIDSGPIVYSDQIKFNVGDTYSEINCKAIVRGVDLMLMALNKVVHGDYAAINQWNEGFLKQSYDYNHFYAYKYFSMIDCRKRKISKSTKNDIITVKNGVKIYNV